MHNGWLRWMAWAVVAIALVGLGPPRTAPGLDEPPWQELLNLDVVASRGVAPGEVYRPTVLVRGAYDDLPRPNVVVDAALTLEDDTALRGSARTDESGRVDFAFELPAPKAGDVIDASFEATVRHRGWTRSIWTDLRVDARVDCVLVSDKRLYQPGQTVHFRAEIATGGRAAADTEVLFEVQTPDHETGYQLRGTTSAFGIAHGEWIVPDHAEPGRYGLSVGNTRHRWCSLAVNVAQYERAPLLVTADVAGPVLPGESASIRVEALTPDGRPRPGARVRILAPDNHAGDEDADDAGDEETANKDPAERRVLARATTGPDGAATLVIDMSDAHRELRSARERGWSPSRRQWLTRRYTIDVVDPLTERRERLHADVRAVLQPLLLAFHVGPAVDRGGLDFLVRVQHADGEPAASTVRLRLPESAGERLSRPVTLHTDSHGVGLVRLDPEITARLEVAETIQLDVEDAAGLRASFLMDFWVPRLPVVIRPSRTLLARGEALALTIESDQARTLDLAIQRGLERVASRVVKVDPGVNEVSFAYQAAFDGVMDVSAWFLMETDVRQTRAVVAYGSERSLRLTVANDRGPHRPGATTRLRFAVTDRAGRPVRAALGIGVVDRTIEARQRQLTGRGPALLDDHRTRIADWTLQDLLDPSLPVERRRALEPLARHLIQGDHSWKRHRASRPIGEERSLYRDLFDDQTDSWRKAMQRALASEPYRSRFDPAWGASLLAGEGFGVAGYRDPWGRPYQLRTTVVGSKVRFDLWSASRDGAWDTRDDFVVWTFSWRYFGPLRSALSEAFERWWLSGGPYDNDPRDDGTHDDGTLEDGGWFDAALAAGHGGVVPLDPWGGRYRFEIEPSWNGDVGLHVWTLGPNGRRDAGPGGDDTVVWRVYLPVGPIYAARAMDCLRGIAFTVGMDVVAHLEQCGESPTHFRDANGVPVAFRVEDEAQFAVVDHYDASTGVTTTERVTERARVLKVMSLGPDGELGTNDDRVLTAYREPYVRRSADGQITRVPAGMRLGGGRGVLTATVRDANGGSLPMTTVRVTGSGFDSVHTTDTRGAVSIDLPPGTYAVSFAQSGFAMVDYPNVRVVANRVLTLDVMLDPLIEEVITVTSESPLVDERRISTGSTIRQTDARDEKPALDNAERSASASLQMAPRIRRHFPETLLWQPEVVTEANGVAEVDLPLADAITTWHVSARAVTQDGRWAVGDADVRVNLPLFVEPDVPPFVTVGDVLRVPTFVHNLGESRRKIALAATLVDATESASATQRGRVRVAPRSESRWTPELRFARAGRSIVEVEAHTTDAGEPAADSVRRSTQVRFDGRRQVATVARLVEGNGDLRFEVPAHALPGSARLRVKVYADPASHFGDALDAMAQRPVGCTEQTISAAYPALLLLERGAAPDTAEPLEQVVASAVATLRKRRSSAGAFGFWSPDRPDLAVTAYAVHFLLRARAHVMVDDRWIDAGVRWLASQQQTDGSWLGRGYDGAIDARVLSTTARVAALLAPLLTDPKAPTETRRAIASAVAFLLPKMAVHGGPGVLADFLLSAHVTSNPRAVEGAITRLRAEASASPDGLIRWRPTEATPFWGRGRAGMVETTARVVLGLLAVGYEAGSEPMIDGGLAFLMAEKDGDGWWGSTHATTQALGLLAKVLGHASQASQDGELAVLLDEQIALEPASDWVGVLRPRVWAATEPLAPGAHALRVTGLPTGRRSLVLATLEHHQAWTADEPPDAGLNLRFEVDCAPQRAIQIGESVTCAIRAERIGRGGMLIASIGLPPGVEVDRVALDRTIASDRSLSRYELRPDRVIVYLWAQPGGTRFDVTWRPRLAMRAQSAPSLLYDYYSPTNRIERRPVRFEVGD